MLDGFFLNYHSDDEEEMGFEEEIVPFFSSTEDDLMSLSLNISDLYKNFVRGES